MLQIVQYFGGLHNVSQMVDRSTRSTKIFTFFTIFTTGFTTGPFSRLVVGVGATLGNGKLPLWNVVKRRATGTSSYLLLLNSSMQSSAEQSPHIFTYQESVWWEPFGLQALEIPGGRIASYLRGAMRGYCLHCTFRVGWQNVRANSEGLTLWNVSYQPFIALISF